MARKTPQEKKALSLANDRRNAYGENDKSSRKNIRRNKTIARRKYRRVLRNSSADPDAVVGEPARAAKTRKSGWRGRKSPDIPLAEFIERQRELAKKRQGRKRSP